mgnify:CR=1 FL=1
MLISHEVPLSLLKNSKRFNDYDYCLLHLTYENEQYRQFYVDSIRDGRHVLLDNSLFELGDALTNDQLAAGVLYIRPTWYVVPDCLHNKDVTIQRFENFKKNYGDLPGIRIGVVQGSTVEELIDCYKYMSENADKIALPFDSKAFEGYTNYADILERWCVGRQLFIQHLVDKGIWNQNKPHHLLGCSYAKEFSNTLYRNISIESCDTSNPVVASIHHLRYGSDGLCTKPSTKLCDLVYHNFNAYELGLLKHNISTFRRICNE